MPLWCSMNKGPKEVLVNRGRKGCKFLFPSYLYNICKMDRGFNPCSSNGRVFPVD